MNTTEKGDTFRDEVDQILAAAGFRTNPETRLDFKKVDNSAVFYRDELNGPTRYLFEAKDYNGTLPKSECIEFVTEYGALVRNNDADHAWLISKGPISPDGKALIEKERGLKCFTFWEFQRRLMLLDGYMRDLIAERSSTGLPAYYIRPETTDGQDLETYVREWMQDSAAPPLFILGPYGKGKSTFATHLAAELATVAATDQMDRVPILIRLGEIVDEQSLDGLIGKVLASKYRVANYHFETFRALNRHGRFLVIYDAFDEMKHGMTFSRFQQVLNELMKLDEGAAKILVLGRDTVLHDDTEFNIIFNGRQRTSAGRDIPDPNRRPYKTVEIRGFTVGEAQEYVKKYLPIRANDIHRQQEIELSAQWLEARLSELLSGNFDELLQRPVHAQMLCEIAAYPESSFQSLTVFELFDTFTHYLLSREVNKTGRHSSFDVTTRRSFNGTLAWWLWERGGASTTTLSDVPLQLCRDAANGIDHDLDDTALKRELIQGCLIEKAADTIYFGHRSLQEFLVADFLLSTDLLTKNSKRSDALERVLKNITPEIIAFIVAGIDANKEWQKSALSWFGHLVGYRNSELPLVAFGLFVQVATKIGAQIPDLRGSPWLFWLDYFIRSGTADFARRGRDTFPLIASAIKRARDEKIQIQAAATYLLARTLKTGPITQSGTGVNAIASMISVPELKTAISKVRGHRNSRHIVKRDSDFLLWSFLRATSIEHEGELVLSISLKQFLEDSQRVLQVGFADEDERTPGNVKIPVQAIYRALASADISDHDIDAIRPFFTEPNTRASIVPIEVEVIRKPTAIASGTVLATPVVPTRFYGGGPAGPK